MSKLSKEYLKQVINLIEKISVEEEDAINQAANKATRFLHLAVRTLPCPSRTSIIALVV